MELKILSFNTQHCLNFLTKQIDFDAVADLIRRLDADIVGLCEMRGKGAVQGYDAQVEILAEKLGYYGYFAPAIMFGGANPYGNGLLSKYPIKNAERIMIPDPVEKTGSALYETRCIINAEIDVAEGINICVSHFGLNEDEHENAVKTLLSLIKQERCIFMGDLNMAPDNKRLVPIRSVMYDTADKIDGNKLTFPSDTPRVKIDYIFTSPSLKVTHAAIPEDVVSDHRAYIITIEI